MAELIYPNLQSLFRAIINNLSEKKTNDKLSLLQKIQSPTWKEYLNLVYNPMINYKLKPERLLGLVSLEMEVDGADRHPTYADMKDLLLFLQTNNFNNGILKSVIDFWRTADEDLRFLFLCAIDRKLKGCTLNTSLINKAYPNLIRVFSVMLAKPFEEGRIQFPCIIEEKIDGVRLIAQKDVFGNFTLYTRTGNIVGLPIIQEELKKFATANLSPTEVGFLDGELTLLGDNRQTISGLANKAIQGTLSEAEKQLPFCYNIFDYIIGDITKDMIRKTPLIERRKEVDSFRTETQHLSIVPCVYGESYEEINSHFQSLLDIGREGVIVKSLSACWEQKRSFAWLKMKDIQTVDLQCYATTEGTGKRKGLIGALKLKDASGQVSVAVGSGFTDQMLQEISSNPPLGEIIEIAYNMLVKDKDGNVSLFLPRFISIRRDKKEADNLSTF